jgi:hypothetical protein
VGVGGLAERLQEVEGIQRSGRVGVNIEYVDAGVEVG